LGGYHYCLKPLFDAIQRVINNALIGFRYNSEYIMNKLDMIIVITAVMLAVITVSSMVQYIIYLA
jgi:hypothetical protein